MLLSIIVWPLEIPNTCLKFLTVTTQRQTCFHIATSRTSTLIAHSVSALVLGRQCVRLQASLALTTKHVSSERHTRAHERATDARQRWRCRLLEQEDAAAAAGATAATGNELLPRGFYWHPLSLRSTNSVST